MTGSVVSWGWADSPSTATPTSSADFESSGRFWSGQSASGLQNGVLNSGDLKLSALSITNTANGTTQMTIAAAGLFWVRSTGGILIPVSYTSDTRTFTPASLPASPNYSVYGVEIDTTGAVTLVKGADTATQLNTGSLIASNSPAITSGRIRIGDFALWNNAGTVNFSDHTTAGTQGVNWIDRRPWARGAYNVANGRTTGDYSTATEGANSVWVLIDTTNLQFRLECTGVPLELRFDFQYASSASATTSFAFYQDGSSLPRQSPIQYPPVNLSGDRRVLIEEFTPPAGSHLYAMAWNRGAGTDSYVGGAAATFAKMLVREMPRQNSNNGTT